MARRLRHQTTAATITPTNGAYLIRYSPQEEDAPPLPAIDAARSIHVAKRIARTAAKDAGYTNLKWRDPNETGDLVLDAVYMA